MDPNTAYIDPRVEVGEGTIILPNTILRGETVIGRDCEIGPNAVITSCVIGDNVQVNSSQVTESELKEGVMVGPYAHIRPGCVVEKNCRIGAFTQLKNSHLGEGTKLPHLSYIGDADVGDHVNFGCGSVTCNYDGFKKSRTVIGSGVFVGLPHQPGAAGGGTRRGLYRRGHHGDPGRAGGRAGHQPRPAGE